MKGKKLTPQVIHTLSESLGFKMQNFQVFLTFLYLLLSLVLVCIDSAVRASIVSYTSSVRLFVVVVVLIHMLTFDVKCLFKIFGEDAYCFMNKIYLLAVL